MPPKFQHTPFSQSRGNRVTTVNSKVLTVEVLVRHGEQHRLRHVDVAARPVGGELAVVLLLGDVALLVLVGLAGRHLGGEDAWGEAVDSDLVAVGGDLGGEHAREVDGGALGGVVGEVVLGFLDHA